MFRKSVRSLCVLSLVAVFAVLAVPALADEGRIPIPFSSPGTPPITIVQPGKYILTRNLKATAGGSCIQVVVPAGAPGDVDIDLNGFILDQTTNPGAAAISVSAGAIREVRIHDGVVQGGARAIEIIGGGGSMTRNLRINWSGSCSTGAEDYGIYEGALGTWYSQMQVDCSDAGADLTEDIGTTSGDRYYFVTPHNPNDEGSYGTDSAGSERPVGSVVCQATQVLTPCP